jgi:LEA14-like dessication related protein
MKWGKLLFLGGAGVALYLVLTRFAGGITTEFTGLKWLGRGTGLRLRFALLYKIGNTNNIPATVSALTGKVFYGEYELNELRVEKAVTVQPGTSEKLEVVFEVKPGLLLAEIERFFEKKDGFKRFRLKGILTGKLGNVPFAYPINEALGLA